MTEKVTTTLLEVHQETPTIKRFVFDVSAQDYVYLPGQWLDLYIEINGEKHVGGYSFTSAPQAKNQTIELAVKASEHHVVTQYLHQQAKVGDVFEISQGQGDCYYQPGMSDKVVLIAGGIGITPLMSIFRTIQQKNDGTHAALIYSAKSPEEFAFAEELRTAAEISPDLLVIFTCTDLELKLPDWVHFQERIDSFFLKTMNLPEEALYFLSGPSPMLREVEEILLELGVPTGKIRYEKW